MPELEHMTERDLLIVNTNEIKNINKKIDDFLLCIDKKVDSNYFRWFLGIFIAATVSLSGFIWQSNIVAADIKSKIATHEQIIKGIK